MESEKRESEKEESSEKEDISRTKRRNKTPGPASRRRASPELQRSSPRQRRTDEHQEKSNSDDDDCVEIGWVVKDLSSRGARRSGRRKIKKKVQDSSGGESNNEDDDNSNLRTRHRPGLGRQPSISRGTARISSSTPATQQKRGRGRPGGTGIGKYRTEQYRTLIDFGIFRDYDFPTGKRVKKGEEEAAKNAQAHMEEVAYTVIQDMYVELTDSLIIPEGAPVNYQGIFFTYILLKLLFN